MRALLLVIIAASPAFADDATTPLGEVDFSLTKHGDSYELHDDAFSVTFPGKPTIQGIDFPIAQTKGHGVMGSLIAGTSEYSVLFKPVPLTVWVNAKQSMDSVQEAFIKTTSAHVISQNKTKLAGLDARHIVATASVNGGTEALDITLAWDGEHRTIVAIVIGSALPQQSASGHAFVDSLAIVRGVRGPLDPHVLPADGVAIPSGVLDLEVVRHGASYVVRNKAVEVTFPRPPTVRSIMTTPMQIVGAESYGDENEGFGFGLAVADPNGTYDPEKGIAGTRDAILKQFDSPPRHTDSKVKRGGLEWRRNMITGIQGGMPTRGELDVAWDPVHRVLLSVMATTRKKAFAPSARAFIDSVVVQTK